GRRRRPARPRLRRRGDQPPPRRGWPRRPPARARAHLARAPVPGDHVPTGGRSMTALTPSLPLPRLVRAEVLKLRKRRGLVAITALLTLVPAVGTYGVLAILHWANPAHHGPAGGVTNLGHGLWVLAILGS